MINPDLLVFVMLQEGGLLSKTQKLAETPLYNASTDKSDWLLIKILTAGNSTGRPQGT